MSEPKSFIFRSPGASPPPDRPMRKSITETNPARKFHRFMLKGNGHAATFDAILDVAKVPRGNGVEAKLKKAFEISLEAHRGQKRKDPDKRHDEKRDYIVHPLASFYYTMVCLKGSPAMGCVALGHDVLEDGPKNGYKNARHSYLRSELGESIAQDICYITTPKCLGPENADFELKKASRHLWIYAEEPGYFEQKDYYRGDGGKYPPEVYVEMRDTYIQERLITYRGIRAFVIKLTEAVDNLTDVENLAPESMERKLKENEVLSRAAARLDWGMYEFMSDLLSARNITVPDLKEEIQSQEEQGVAVCNPRRSLDYSMALRQLPIKHPASSVFTVFRDYREVHTHDVLELGLPKIGNGNKLSMLEECFPGLRFEVGRSLFHGAFDLGAKESIYRVRGLSENTYPKTVKSVKQFLGKLKSLQSDVVSRYGIGQ